MRRALGVIAVAAAAISLVSTGADAAEAGFSVYGLGESAFNAGITPPPSLYISGIGGYYTGVINASATVGGVPIQAGAKVKFFQAATNILYVPAIKILNGQPGFSITLPVGYVDLTANLSAGGTSVSREVQGPGLGDIVPRAQLGWSNSNNSFFNTAYVEAVLPTGTYAPGFTASTGLNRPAVDLGWAFTWIEPTSKIQLNATAGLTFNLENVATQYQSGTEFHFEWAVAKGFGNGWTLGLVGYDYRQLTGDSGPGATAGPFKGAVDAVGPGVNYSTEINKKPASFDLRYYQELDATNRFQGSSTLATATFAF